MTNKIKINLRISEIPSIIGYNPYANIKPIVLRIWEKALPEDYKDFTTKLLQNKIIDNTHVKDEDIIAHHSQKYNIDMDAQLKSCRTAETTQELKKKAENMLNSIENNKQITSEDKKTIQKSLHQLSKTNYGQHHEDSIITLYSQIHNIKVGQQQKFVRKKIAFCDKFEWYINGKVDGIRDDDILVEVKNRVNKLFLHLKPYENIQVQIYLNLLKLKIGHLVECHKHEAETEMNVIEVKYNKKIWKDIKYKLEVFINFFNAFISSDDMKLIFLTGNDSGINKYYQNWMISNMVPIS